MRGSIWRIVLLACFLVLLQVCSARDHIDNAQQPLAPSNRDDGFEQSQKTSTSYSAQPTSHHESDKDVRNALKILQSIPPPKLSLVRLTRTRGFLGSTVYYAQELFDLLFRNGPPDVNVSEASPTASAAKKLTPILSKAVERLELAAAEENPHALWLLAEMNFYGNYTYPRNYTAAFHYYQQLAQLNGNASAQHMLGFMYATGIGGVVEKDQARALLYHTFAADGGDVRSQMTVGFRHHVGIGTPRHCDTAVKYYRQAAKTSVDYYKSGPPGGHVLVRSAYRIADTHGGVYGEGASIASSGQNAKTGGPTSDAYADIADVVEYLEFQSRKGELGASFNLAKLYYDGHRGMERDMKSAKRLFMMIARMFWTSSGKINEDASTTVQKLAPRAAGHLGRMFLRSEGMEQSYEKAIIWFKRGIDYGDVLSQYSMGVMYMQGLGVPKDPIRAASYLGPAADNDMAVAQTDLGVLFLDQGDVQTARNYFELAIRSGHIEAFYYLAEIAHLGIGRERSCGVAASFYKIAAEKAEVTNSAFIEANEAYERGDKQTALVAYMMAAEQGYENAQANVAWLLDQTKPLYSLPRIISLAMQYLVNFLSSLVSYIPTMSSLRDHSSLVNNADAALSLIYYTRSARQNNIDSLMKAGDLHLASLGTATSVSPAQGAEHAAACYSAAADSMRSAQAMWNLGWMHETGVGVEKDYHLAKRYYDLAAGTNKEAWAPVKIALFGLRWKSWWNGVSGGDIRGIQDGDEKDAAKEQKKRRTFWEWLETFLENDARMNAVDDDWIDTARDMQLRQDDMERGQGANGMGGEGFPGDDYLLEQEIEDGLVDASILVGLAGLLAGLVWWRQQRVRRANAALDAERRAGLNGAPEAYGQPVDLPPLPAVDGDQVVENEDANALQEFFPAPDDPDFAPWAANGVGH